MSETKTYYRDKNGELKSWIHDIPTYPDKRDTSIVNMIVEIPKGTVKKMEMSVYDLYNPIKQDIKRGKPRVVPAQRHRGVDGEFSNESINDDDSVNEYGIETYGDIFDPSKTGEFSGYNLFSYGAIPQTFENDNIEFKYDGTSVPFEFDTGGPLSVDELLLNLNDKKPCKGDGDPLDICLLNDTETRRLGDIVPVKVMGVFPMIDEGEIDWKIVAVPQGRERPTDKEIYLAKLWFKYYKDDDKDQPKGLKVKIGDMLDIDVAENVIEHCKKDYNDITGADIEDPDLPRPDISNYLIRKDGQEKEHPHGSAYKLFKSYQWIKTTSGNFNVIVGNKPFEAFPETVDNIFADHSYHVFNIPEIEITKDGNNRPLKVITANGGSIFHPTKGINNKFGALLGEEGALMPAFDKEDNYKLIEAMVTLVYKLLKNYNNNLSVQGLDEILKKFQQGEPKPFKYKEDSIDYDRFEKLIKNLENFKVEAAPKEPPLIKEELDIDLIEAFAKELNIINSKIKKTPNDVTNDQIKKILEKYLVDSKSLDKQYPLFRDLPGLLKAQTTGGFKIPYGNPYGIKEAYLKILESLAEKCDVLILTEGIQMIGENEEIEINEVDKITKAIVMIYNKKQKDELVGKLKAAEKKAKAAEKEAKKAAEAADLAAEEKAKEAAEEKAKEAKEAAANVRKIENTFLFKENLGTTYSFVSLDQMKDGNYEETTNIIYKEDLGLNVGINSLSGVSITETIDLNNSSLVTIKKEGLVAVDEEFDLGDTNNGVNILNIHGPSNGTLRPDLLKEIHTGLSPDGNPIKYICGDGNMDDYYKLEGRPYIQEDFKTAFGKDIELKVADFVIKKIRPFAMPIINNQFWKGTDPEKYDVQFALTIGEKEPDYLEVAANTEEGHESPDSESPVLNLEGANLTGETVTDDPAPPVSPSVIEVIRNLEGKGVRPEVPESGLGIGGPVPAPVNIDGGSRKKTKKRKYTRISNKNNRYKNYNKKKNSMKNKKHKTKKRRKRVL